MALTLTEAAKLSNDTLMTGVVETIVKDSPILQQLPFIEVVGNGLTYNQEKTLPGIDFYDVGDTWAESTPTIEQLTANLKIMGGDADVDNFLKTTRSDLQDLEAAVLEAKSKALRHKFEEVFLYGNSSTNTKQFDGLRKLLDTTTPGSQVVLATTTNGGGALTLNALDKIYDAVKGGKPDMLLMSRRSRRKINHLVRTSGAIMETNRDAFGNFIQMWNGVPIGITDWQLDTHSFDGSAETGTTGGDCSVIYAVQFGEGALCGLTAPGGLTVEPIGALQDKDASRVRCKWYVSLALFSSLKAAALIGFDDT